MRAPSETVAEIDLTQRRYVVPALTGIVLLVLAFTVLYNVGMATLEGRPQSLLTSFQIVVETMTTSGYGADAPWETAPMNLLVAAMQLSGLGIVVLVVLRITVPLFTSD
jgi:hypothetical protein